MRAFFLWLVLFFSCPATAQGPIGATVGGPDLGGSRIACEIPPQWHVRNRGGSDGAGLCVFASLRHAGLWQNNEVFAAMFEFMFTRPGGGYPQKVTQMVAACAQSKGLAAPIYIQIEDNDLDVLRAACATGRCPGVTYGYSPTGRYGGRRIAHMVSLVHAQGDQFVILDNNYPGENQYERMSAAEFLRAYSAYGTGWCVILLDPPPPPMPWN